MKKLNTLLMGMFSAIILTACSYHQSSNTNMKDDEYKQLGYTIEANDVTPLEAFVVNYGNEMTSKFSSMLNSKQMLDIEVVDGYELVLTFVSHDAYDIPDFGLFEQQFVQMTADLQQQLDVEAITLTLKFIGSDDTIVWENSWMSHL